MKKSIGARVGRVLSRFFTSVWVRNIVISVSMLLSLFLVFVIDAKNGIRTKLLHFLEFDFVYNTMDKMGIERFDVQGMVLAVLGVITAGVVLLLLGNSYAAVVSNNMAEGRKHPRTVFAIVYIISNAILLGLTAVVAYLFNLWVIKRGVALDVPAAEFGAGIGYLFLIAVGAFVAVTVLVALVAFICALFCKKPAKEAPVEEAPVEEAPVEEAPAEEAPVEEAPAEEVPVEEAHVEEAPVEEVPVEEAPVEKAPAVEVPVAPEGMVMRLNKSFMGKLAQTTEKNLAYYSEIKNHLLAYKKVNDRTSWNYDSFNLGRDTKAKITVRGKTLILLLALDPKEFEDSKYYCYDESGTKKFADVPLLIKVKSNRALKHAKELIDIMMKDVEKRARFTAKSYEIQPMDDEALVLAGMAKYVKSKY